MNEYGAPRPEPLIDEAVKLPVFVTVRVTSLTDPFATLPKLYVGPFEIARTAGFDEAPRI